MWQQLLGMLGGMNQQQQPQQSDMLARKRQYWQQLLAGVSPMMPSQNARYSTSQNNMSDMFNLMNLLGGQQGGGQRGGGQQGGNMNNMMYREMPYNNYNRMA